MSEATRTKVEKFYAWNTSSELEETRDLLHEDVQLFWNSNKGFRKYGKDQILELINSIRTEYQHVRAEMTHLLAEEDRFAVRLTYFVEPYEHPDEEIPLVHFMAIWELKDGKLFKGYEMSHLADEDPDNIISFSRLPEREIK